MKSETNMLRVFLTALVAMLLLSAASIMAMGKGGDAERGQELNEEDLPPAVMSAFQSAYPDADIKEVRIAGQGGSTEYHIKAEDGDTERTIIYNNGGSLLRTSEKMASGDLPASVQQGITSAYPDADIKSVERVSQNNRTTFDVVIDMDGSRSVVTFDEAGQRLQTRPFNEEMTGDGMDSPSGTDQGSSPDTTGMGRDTSNTGTGTGGTGTGGSDY